jgi:hypothetical protein
MNLIDMKVSPLVLIKDPSLLRTDALIDGQAACRFGVLVHAMLASVELDADIDSIRSMAGINGRIVVGQRSGIAGYAMCFAVKVTANPSDVLSCISVCPLVRRAG